MRICDLFRDNRDFPITIAFRVRAVECSKGSRQAGHICSIQRFWTFWKMPAEV
jgi:hypothetical protein